MATQWGRKETIIWPPHVPMLSYTAVATALLCTCLFVWQRFTFSLTALQRSYITEYIRSDIGAKFTAHESYRLLYLGGGKGKPRLAFPVDFVPGETTLPNGKVLPVALSGLATAQGYRWFYRGPEQKLADLSLNRWLRLTVFEDKGLLSLFAISFIEGGVCLAVMLWCAVPYDIRRFKQMKYGRILRGPQLLSPREFNSAQKGDGIGFKTTESGKMMRIPARKEAQHFQIMGDTGVGKTQLIVQMLCQIQARGESAIVYDPGEHASTKTFLNETQRRVIEQVLNSADRIHGLQGLAGSGKTSSLQSIREGAESAGYKVEGFAPTSKAAGQLREAGIEATTLQSFLARGRNHSTTEPPNQHLYMLDESSLASTRQMRSFLGRLNSEDRVLVIGDTRQHQGVDAGRPFQQMQEAGMQTSNLDKIMRQKDPELLKAVQHLANNETVRGIAMLSDQGRVTEIPNGPDRIAAIAKDYVADPESTIIVSPDNASRRAINQAVRQKLQSLGMLDLEDRSIKVLTPRSDMTGADRAWATRYEKGDVLHYIRGSKENGIAGGSYAEVVAATPRENLVTVRKPDGALVTYDPSRLRGISAYREIEREFAIGDRVQMTAPNRDLQVANRELGTLLSFDAGGRVTLRMDTGKDVSFDPREMRHFDHGYAVTSHSSQGLTSERVLVNMDTEVHPGLINGRFAYVSVSRASQDAQIFTNNAADLAESLKRDVSKTSALGALTEQFSAPKTLKEQGQIISTRPDVEFGLAL